MNRRFLLVKIVFICAIFAALFCRTFAARGGSRKGKGKGKNMLRFGNVAEYSLIAQNQAHPDGARIRKGSHFSQTFRLGFKILLICIAEGRPRPTISWYKDGAEIHMRPAVHTYEKWLGSDRLWSKIEIDPATMGDQGIYSCMAHNKFGSMAKNFKADYTY